ncbi:MAG TPA: phosphatidate cytidylyltransferase [Thermodesulfobacteriota bacterium]|nr:phosphatidate cytidylyltransferase [Thermodesulfobacteriota bacterium]
MGFSNDHRDRLLTGLIGVAIIFLVVGYSSKPIFFVFILLVNLFALKEFYDLVSISKISRLVGIILGMILSGGFFYFERPGLFAWIAGASFSFCLFKIVTFENPVNQHSDFKKHLIGIFVIVFLLSHLIWLRGLNQGRLLVFFLLAIIFSGDIFAFYGGKLFGRHKLSPKISPGKTQEGAFLGLIGNILGGLIFAFFFFPEFSFLTIIFFAGIAGILGQLGDLWESILKREAKVKDSGKCLPGHGGVLDRMDSLFFSAPFFYYVIIFQERLL